MEAEKINFEAPKVTELETFLPTDLFAPLILLKSKFVNMETSVILNFLIFTLVNMYSCKRIKITGTDEPIIMNWFAIIFMGSGEGKDFLHKQIRNHLMKRYYEWFEQQAEALYQQQLAIYNQQNQETQVELKNLEEGVKANGKTESCPF